MNDNPPSPESITVVGLGYVGLPAALAFAKAGLDVAGLDVDETKIDRLRSGENPLDDTPLDGLSDAIETGALTPTTDPAEAIPASDAVILAVPTPVSESKDPDLSALTAAAGSIGPHLSQDTLVVLESTVYPGCTEEVLIPALEQASGLEAGEDFGIAYCPERLNPGDPEHTIDQVVRVLGATSRDWLDVGRRLYERIVPEVHEVPDLATAEAAKVIENVQRDLNIALVNELSLVFDEMDVDVQDVLDAAATKWNFHRYDPGPGVGGHCLPVDPYYLTWKADSLDFHPDVILAGRSVNDGMPDHVVRATAELLNELRRPVNGEQIAVLGLAYKPNTGDLRNAPSLAIARKLAEMGGDVRAVDPHVDEQALAGEPFEHLELEEALDGARVAVLAVPHDAFEGIEASTLRKRMADPAGVVDASGWTSSTRVEEVGLRYRGLGRT